jgi:hypothetical protein
VGHDAIIRNDVGQRHAPCTEYGALRDRFVHIGQISDANSERNSPGISPGDSNRGVLFPMYFMFQLY